MSPDGAPRNAEHAGEEYRVAPEPPPAKEQTSRWPGWIWSIPIAAIAIVAWLAFKQITATGPSVVVTFDNAAGVSAGNTQVHYDGMKVGEVESVHLAKDLRHVEVHLQMNSDMDGHLGSGTEFWITGASPSLSNLSSLRSIISGPTIEMAPHDGKTQHHFVGLQQPPVLPETVPGRDYVLLAGQKGNLNRGSDIYFKGENVGAVAWTELQPDKSFKIGIFIKAPYDALVLTGTRFWDAGAVQLSMQGSGPRLQIQSPMAVLQGAIGFETPPGSAAGGVAQQGAQFKLYPDKDAAEYAAGPGAVSYTAVFDATGGGLAENAPVELAGKRVGTVQDTELLFEPETGAVQEQVTLALEPSRMKLAGGATWDHPREQMNDLLNKLIARGLRAELGSSVPVVGAKEVQLTFAAGPSDASLMAGNPPQIPSQSGGGGIEGIMTAVNKITGKLDSLPLDQIAQNIRTITARAAELATSPQLKQALQNLDSTAANVQHLTASADRQVPQIIAQLRQVATEADATIKSAHSLLNNQSGVTATGLQTTGLSQTLYQLSEAARAVRQLADYLDRNPSALIRGRS